MASAHPDVLRAIAVTAELTGREFSKAAVRLMAEDLAEYPVEAVLAALARSRAEVSAPLTLAHIIARLDDGRPGAEEAWALALRSEDEHQTVVLTPEIIEAMTIARPVLDAGDEVGARMAFKESYGRIVSQARATRQPVAWQASLGWDADLRAAAVQEGVRAGWLPPPTPPAMLPLPTSGRGGKPEPAHTARNIQRLRETLSQLKNGLAKGTEVRAARVAVERAQLVEAKQAAAEKVEGYALRTGVAS
ncbi:hypothetical protein [Paracidovorax citrulli]